MFGRRLHSRLGSGPSGVWRQFSSSCGVFSKCCCLVISAFRERLVKTQVQMEMEWVSEGWVEYWYQHLQQKKIERTSVEEGKIGRIRFKLIQVRGFPWGGHSLLSELFHILAVPTRYMLGNYLQRELWGTCHWGCCGQISTTDGSQ